MGFLCAKLAELDRRIRVGAVSYLNTRPLLFGLLRSGLMDRIDLIEEYPARIAQMLLNDEIDVGLVPVAIIPLLKESHLVTDYCIGSTAQVASVAIFSDVPIEEVETLLMDYQSRTSVKLAKILLRDHWHLQPELKDAKEDFRLQISGKVAGVVIGDRALEQRKTSKYIYDLSAEWKEMTGLPFVFAAWVSNKQLGDEFEDAFNKANGYGVAHLEEVVAAFPYETYDLGIYYNQNISYQLDEEKKKGMALFLEKLKTV